ncbi:amino acid ABC transporter permease [Paenarthrobacter sp. NPDC091711]|uniref:amino acid ABC transporter permease n=1 Tax=Paenarthrobacter sp. NPDC091711 TaxID=3364385 RepID=UPI003808B6B6
MTTTPTGATPLTQEPSSRRPLRIIRKKKTGQVILAVAMTVLVAALVLNLAGNPNMQWSTMWEHVWDPQVLKGLWTTVVLTVICMITGTLLGVLLATMALSNNKVLRVISVGYVWIFRGTPLLVQLIIWYNLAAIFPTLGIGIPFTSLGISIDTNTAITGFVAALLGFTLNEAAYMSEIVRASIGAVDTGQAEAAKSIGMGSGMTMRRIVLPQAMRVLVPPTANQAISMLKATSLVAFIAGGDLLTAVQDIYSVNFAVIPLLLTACFWYLVVVSIASIGQHFLERKVGKGFTTFTAESALAGIPATEKGEAK